MSYYLIYHIAAARDGCLKIWPSCWHLPVTGPHIAPVQVHTELVSVAVIYQLHYLVIRSEADLGPPSVPGCVCNAHSINCDRCHGREDGIIGITCIIYSYLVTQLTDEVSSVSIIFNLGGSLRQGWSQNSVCLFCCIAIPVCICGLNVNRIRIITTTITITITMMSSNSSKIITKIMSVV